MSFWKAVFATPQIATEAVSGVINGVDAVFHTNEEKSAWYLKWLQATTGAALARRLIAMIVAALWAVLIIVMITAQGAGAADFAKFVFDVLTDIVGIPFGLIMSFYFLKHAITK